MTEGRWYSTALQRHLAGWFGASVIVIGVFFFLGGFEKAEEGDAQEALTAWIWGVTWVVGGSLFLIRGRRAGVRLGPDGLEVRNFLRSYFFRWSEIAWFRPGPEGGLVSVGVVLLKNGSDRPLHGLRYWERSGPDPLIEDLNGELRHRGSLVPPKPAQ